MRFLQFICLLFLFSCNQEQSTKITVGTSADNPPYEFLENGKIVGFDVDFAQALSEEMGKEIYIKNMDFISLIPALNSRHVDMLVAALSISEARAQHVDFSDVYVTSKIAVLTKKQNNIRSLRDMSEKNIGVQLGSTWEMIARDLQHDDLSISVTPMNSNLVLAEELKNDRISAMIVEELQAIKFSDANPDLEYFILEEKSSEFAIVLPKNSEMTDEVNKAIESLKAKGKIRELQEKWLQS